MGVLSAAVWMRQRLGEREKGLSIQALGSEEALDAETGSGTGTISVSQEECEDSVWVQAWRRWLPDSASRDSV